MQKQLQIWIKQKLLHVLDCHNQCPLVYLSCKAQMQRGMWCLLLLRSNAETFQRICLWCLGMVCLSHACTVTSTLLHGGNPELPQLQMRGATNSSPPNVLPNHDALKTAYLMRSMVPLNTLEADFGAAESDSKAIPYSMKERAAPRY